ncbi:MAG: SDR family oxidoreductase [Dehalococcoidia bacterium]
MVLGQPNYSAAHFGKIGLMLSNAQALGRYGVTCNAISPNAATRMTDRGLTNQESQREGALPPSMTSAGTTLDPKNVVPTIVYLASDQGGNVTGHAFGVMGYQVSVWHMMEWENSIYWHEPYWDIDKLFEVMPKTLAYGGNCRRTRSSPRPRRQRRRIRSRWRSHGYEASRRQGRDRHRRRRRDGELDLSDFRRARRKGRRGRHRRGRRRAHGRRSVARERRC